MLDETSCSRSVDGELTCVMVVQRQIRTRGQDNTDVLQDLPRPLFYQSTVVLCPETIINI